MDRERLRCLPGLRGVPVPRVLARTSSAARIKVLRGGSWATQAGAVTTTFRNWDHPRAPADLRRLPVCGGRGGVTVVHRHRDSAREPVRIDVHLRDGDAGLAGRRRAQGARPAIRASSRPSTSTTRAARSCSSRSPSCPSTTPPRSSRTILDAAGTRDRGARAARGDRRARPRVRAQDDRAAATRWSSAGCGRRYVPVDVSETAVQDCAARLVAQYESLAVHGVVGDFERHLDRIPPRSGRRLIAFLGGTIGNLDHRAAAPLLLRRCERSSAPTTGCSSAPTWSRTGNVSRPPTTTPPA